MKYIVREGFIAAVKVRTQDGQTHDKTYVGGDVVELNDDIAAQHLHKLELADPKDRAAALKAEESRKMSGISTPDLIQQLVTALASTQKTEEPKA